MTENMHRNISGTAENVACVAGGICVRVLYILFLRPKIEFRIVFAAEPREEWAQYGEEGRPCLPNILVKNIYIFPTVKSALLLLFKISSKYGPVKGRGREGEVFIKD